jgi:hypothetical protein
LSGLKIPKKKTLSAKHQISFFGNLQRNFPKTTTYTKGSRKEYKKEAIIKHNILQDTNQRYICSLKTLTLFFFLQKTTKF